MGWFASAHGKTQGPSTTHESRYARSRASLGMTVLEEYLYYLLGEPPCAPLGCVIRRKFKIPTPSASLRAGSVAKNATRVGPYLSCWSGLGIDHRSAGLH